MFAPMQFDLDFQFDMSSALASRPMSTVYEYPGYFYGLPTPTDELGNKLDGPCAYPDDLASPGSAPFSPSVYVSSHPSVIGSYDSSPDERIALSRRLGNKDCANAANRTLTPLSPLSPLRPCFIGSISTPTTPLSSASSSVDESLSPWVYDNGNYASIFHRSQPDPLDVDALELEADSQASLDPWLLWQPPSPSCRAATIKLAHAIRKRSPRILPSQRLAPAASSACGHDAIKLDLVHKPMFKCRYQGCDKAFRRREHLKRHKQTFHGEGPNRFACEFCGRDQFNRQDNLNNHRKLHARPSRGNRTVKFIPAAIAIIEQEERNRKRQSSPRNKPAAKQRDGTY